jgi:hypothetical protein
LKKEGVLVAPFAGRRETEKLGPQIERELEIMMNVPGADRALPPEVIEAGLKPSRIMTNPLSRMARAEEVSGFTRTAELAIQLASAGAEEALDIINWEEGIRDTADVLGARPTHINTPRGESRRSARPARRARTRRKRAGGAARRRRRAVPRAGQSDRGNARRRRRPWLSAQAAPRPQSNLDPPAARRRSSRCAKACFFDG